MREENGVPKVWGFVFIDSPESLLVKPACKVVVGNSRLGNVTFLQRSKQLIPR